MTLRQSVISLNIQVVRLYISLMPLATLLVAVCSLTTKDSNRYQVRPYPIDKLAQRTQIGTKEAIACSNT